MSIDKIVIDKVKEKFKEKNQSEELIQDIISLLNKRDSEKLSIEKKNELLEKILDKTKL
jgi:predicted Zn-dependent protease